MHVQVPQPLVLSPDVDYQKISIAMQSLGWRPVEAGHPKDREPRSVTFSRTDGESIRYTSDPSVNFRVLELAGVSDWLRRLAIAAALPVLTDEQVSGLLESNSRRQALLGLLACELRVDRSAIDLVRRHLTSDDDDVAEVARRCVERLTAQPD